MSKVEFDNGHTGPFREVTENISERGSQEEKYGSDEVEDAQVIDYHVPEKYRGTAADRHDMAVLGKQQVLRRNFKSITMLGFASMVMVAWEALLVIIYLPLGDGGPSVIFWGLLLAPVGLFFVYASLAELASMSPTAGGQYHWVSEMAPPRYQKVLSYYTGWLIALGWQTWLCGTCFMAASALQGIISLNKPDYEWTAWHGTLLVIGIIVFSVFFNTVLASRLPLVEGGLLMLHVVGLFAIIIPLWVMGPRGNAHDLILTVPDDVVGYPSKGLSYMIGLTMMISLLYGYDCMVHMSEEVRDAAKTIPPTIIWGMVSNAMLMFLVGVTFIFTMGDLTEILATPAPFIQVFLNATQSYPATNAMASVIAITLISACFSEVATASRQIWAFARDDGLPCSRWLSRVTPGWNIPLNAVTVSIGFTTALSLINLGNEDALNAVNSLAQVAILSSYAMTICCLIWRRLFGAPLPPRPWSLGKFGLAVNIIAVCFIIPIFLFALFPPMPPPDAGYMNWASVIFVGVLVIATVFYFLEGRKKYAGPIALVKRNV